jgi:hypothetical protein
MHGSAWGVTSTARSFRKIPRWRSASALVIQHFRDLTGALALPGPRR